MMIPLAVAALVLGIFPQPLLNLINPFAQHFTDIVISHGNNIRSILNL
jgi:NADH-quinone oxidoreductase subunit M